MRRLLCLIFGLIICITAHADTINVNWIVDGNTYDTSTCTVGGDLILPTPPTPETGYHFVGWGVAGYAKLEYIESSGTQYIDTGVYPNANTKIRIHGIQGPTDSALFGLSLVLYCFDNASTGTHYNFCNNSGSLQIRIASTDVTIIMSASDGLVINGTQYATLTPGTSTSNYPMALFGRTSNTDGAIAKLGSHRIYSCELWDNGVLVRNFVPAKRKSDNVIGMYDTVSGQFFTNAGTGVFIAGPETGEYIY